MFEWAEQELTQHNNMIYHITCTPLTYVIVVVGGTYHT